MLCLCVVCCRSEPRILSEYGTRIAVARNADGFARGRSAPHDGVDIGLYQIGDPVIASADGIVSWIGDDPKYGTEVVITHPREYRTGYLHLSRATVKIGDRVPRGTTIGEVGLFWGSGGVIHVHWRLWPARGVDTSSTEDPLLKTTGCFDGRKVYPNDRLVLTYPVRC
jgi:murein DD-endopeptidase MepM/ murein hydrolase activator NlpD